MPPLAAQDLHKILALRARQHVRINETGKISLLWELERMGLGLSGVYKLRRLMCVTKKHRIKALRYRRHVKIIYQDRFNRCGNLKGWIMGT
jgi:hypothetical protein